MRAQHSAARRRSRTRGDVGSRAMTGIEEADVRATALDTYLAHRASQGFRIETRSAAQAVIVRRHPLHFVLRWVARTRAEERLVVSVDQHGAVTSSAAEPLRW